VLPFVALMVVAVVLICLVPGIATAFPNWVMGPPTRQPLLGRLQLPRCVESGWSPPTSQVSVTLPVAMS
ncbi:MAG: hypothetical protein ABW218_07785, partial [Casimicrobiaceae bacterium]